MGYMKINFYAIFSLFFLFLILFFTLVPFVSAINDLMSLQGNVKVGSTNLGSGNLTIYIFDSPTGTVAVWNSTLEPTGYFNNSIVAGKYDVILGNSSVNELNLEYGRLYYFEMYVNTERLSFNGSTRQVFQSTVGQVNGTFINPNQINSTHLIQNIDLSNATQIQAYAVNKSTGTSFIGEFLDSIIDQLVGRINSVNSTINLQALLNSTGIYSRYNVTYESTYNETYASLQSGNASWNQSFANTLFAGNTTGAIQYLLNSTGVYSVYNQTYESTYNASYISGNPFDQHLNRSNLVAFDSLNITNVLRVGNTLLQADAGGTLNVSGTTNFNGGWNNGGITIRDGQIFVQTLFVVNITSLGVSDLYINGSLIPSPTNGSYNFNNTFDVGNLSTQWRNGYFGTDVYINSRPVALWLYNQTAPAMDAINSVNTTVNLQTLLNATDIYSRYNLTYESTYNVTYESTFNSSYISGNPFDQHLNTTSNVIHANLTVNGNLSVMNGSNTVFYINPITQRVAIGTNNTNGAGLTLYLPGSGANLILEKTTLNPQMQYNINGIGAWNEYVEYTTGTYVLRNVYKSADVISILNDTSYVGIGTSTPGSTLHVAGNLTVANNAIYGGNITLLNNGNITIRGNSISYGNLTIIGNLSVDAGTLYVDGVNNRVGIGTTAPQALSHIASSDATIPSIASTTHLLVSATASTTTPLGVSFVSGNNRPVQINLGDQNDEDAGYLRYNHSEDSFAIGVNLADRLKIDSAGDVGIGVISPLASLHVNGSVILNGSRGTSGGNIDIQGGTATSATGGGVVISGGTGPAGGVVALIAGTSTDSSDGANLFIGAGAAPIGNTGGNVFINPGIGGGGLNGGVHIANVGGIIYLGSTTTSGQVELEDGGLCVGDGGCTAPTTDGQLRVENDIFGETTLQIGSTSDYGVAYNVFSTATPSPEGANIGAANDVYIGDSLEVEGTFYLAGGSAAISNADIAEVLLTQKGRESILCNGDPNCIAQPFEKDELDYGDLVCINPQVAQTIIKCTSPDSKLAVGFVSDTAKIKMGNTEKYGYPIALAGVVNAKVTNENGAIMPGDLLVSSSKYGYAMKSDNPQDGTVVGKAYDFCDQEECKIIVFVALS